MAEIDPAGVQEALDEARRGVAEATLIADRHHDRLSSLLRLGIAESAGVIAVFGLLINTRIGIGTAAGLLFALGVGFGALAMGGSVLALSGILVPRRSQVCASPREMARLLAEQGVDRLTLQWNLLRVVGLRLEGLHRHEVRITRVVATVTWSILISTGAYLSALGYIATEGMHG